MIPVIIYSRYLTKVFCKKIVELWYLYANLLFSLMERANGGVCSTWSRKFVPFDVCIMDIMIYINGCYMYMYSYCCQGQTFLGYISGIKLIVSFVTIHDTFLYLIIFILCLLFFSRWFWFGTCDCLVLRNLYFRRQSFIIRNINLYFACAANALNQTCSETCCVTCFGHVFCPK
jgi:hypothetical protein